MPSLNGACTGPPASLITLRVACGVGCENTPRTVKTPATIKTIATILIRRFMFCLPSINLPAMPRECNTQTRPRQASEWHKPRYHLHESTGAAHTPGTRPLSCCFPKGGVASFLLEPNMAVL